MNVLNTAADALGINFFLNKSTGTYWETTHHMKGWCIKGLTKCASSLAETV